LDLIASNSLTDNQVKRNFIQSIKSPKTKENYVHALHYFMDFLKIDREDYGSLIADEPLMVQSRIIDYIIYCKDVKRLSPGTIHTDTAAIKHFYIMNDIELKWKKINSFEGEYYRVVEDRAYTHEEIKKMVDVADLRDKALLLLMASSGMRLGAIPPLQIKDLTPIADLNLYQIEVYKKYKERYITYCTPECRKAIDDYLDYRRRCGERIQTNTPLFRKLFDKYDSIQTAHPIPVATSTIKNVVKELLDKTGIRPPARLTEEEIAAGKRSKRTNLPAIHGFRKFAITNMIRAKLEYNARERLVGHTLKTLDLNYDRREQEELLQEYAKAIDFLTVDNSNKLKREVEHYKVKASQFEVLRAEIDGLKEALRNR
jgi:integrase